MRQGLFLLPALLEPGELFIQFCQTGLDLLVAVRIDFDAVQLVPLLRLFLPLQCLDGALLVLNHIGLGGEQHLHPSRGRVQQIHGLVGQLAAGNVAAGEGRRRFDGVVSDYHMVSLFIFAL